MRWLIDCLFEDKLIGIVCTGTALVVLGFIAVTIAVIATN